MPQKQSPYRRHISEIDGPVVPGTWPTPDLHRSVKRRQNHTQDRPSRQHRLCPDLDLAIFRDSKLYFETLIQTTLDLTTARLDMTNCILHGQQKAKRPQQPDAHRLRASKQAAADKTHWRGPLH
jgi:hypothetical protein